MHDMNYNGKPLGVKDRNGHPIHYGDLLYFDEKEWGAPDCFFRVEFDRGKTNVCGRVSDLPQWCDIVEKWDGTKPTSNDRCAGEVDKDGVVLLPPSIIEALKPPCSVTFAHLEGGQFIMIPDRLLHRWMTGYPKT